MTWSPPYSREPRNPSPLDVTQSAVFGPSVLSAVGDMRLKAYLLDKSIAWSSVDLTLTTEFPIAPKDREEINFLIDSTNQVVVRMLWRDSTGTWTQIGKPPYVTALPTVPTGFDNIEVYYVADDTNGVVWHLIYDSGETTYKWRYIGGPPMRAYTDGSSTTASTSFADLAAGAGPTLTLPALAGDYDISVGAQMLDDTLNNFTITSYAVGATAASDTWGAIQTSATANAVASSQRDYRHTAVASGAAIVAKYRVSGGTGTFSRRTLLATPVRVI